MSKRCVFLLSIALAFGSLAPGPCLARPKDEPPPDPGAAQVLILYDSSGEWGWIGAIHARLLANLLGHFPVTYKASPIERYHKGSIGRYDATFYIGSTYDNPLPSAFVRDVMRSTTPVCWFKYNIWQPAWSQSDFPTKFGFTFNWLDWTGYDTIHYLGETFTKYQADPELGLVWILYPDRCSQIASACVETGPDQQECIPYIVKGGNLWYVADLPFSYVSEEDRYLVFCDVLHDILGIDHPESRRAVVRIEDVDPNAAPEDLCAIADYLHAQQIPFAVSVVPAYADPFGYYNQGVPEYNRLSWEPELVDALHYMVARGGQIVLHGATHQYDTVPNPYTGVTGDDFEFYRVELDEEDNVLYAGPVPNDSKRWVSTRVGAALDELRLCGLQEVGWETPHYAASARDYKLFAAKFPLTIQRVLYFDLAIPPDGFKGHGEPTFFGSQFFPYVIGSDIYGQKVIPENLGNVEPEPWQGYPPRLPEDIIRAAQKNLAIRDGWASCYFHHFYDLSYLQETVEGIKALGYTFVPLSAGLE